MQSLNGAVGGPLLGLLQDAGCRMDPDEFCRRISRLFTDMFPGKTIEHVLCEPGDAVSLCWIARRKLGAPAIPDRVILWTLLNLRKRSKMPRTSDRRVGEPTFWFGR